MTDRDCLTLPSLCIPFLPSFFEPREDMCPPWAQLNALLWLVVGELREPQDAAKGVVGTSRS